MNIEFMGGRGKTVILLTSIWAIHFWKSGGFGLLWGAVVGTYRVQ